MEQPTRDIFVIAASAGGVQALQQLVSEFPADLAAAVFVVVHIGANRQSFLPQILSRAGPLPAYHPVHGQPIEQGRIYVAPPDFHMRLRPGGIHLDRSAKIHCTRPAADPLFQSAAETYGSRVGGIVLTGGGFDGTTGARSIVKHGGLIVIQHPDEAHIPSMPLSILEAGLPHYCLILDDIADLLVDLNKGRIRSAADDPHHA
jgi:two-component system, chemotaxis family, protein-glutamate methylesterase/glutaminase